MEFKPTDAVVLLHVQSQVARPEVKDKDRRTSGGASKLCQCVHRLLSKVSANFPEADFSTPLSVLVHARGSTSGRGSVSHMSIATQVYVWCGKRSSPLAKSLAVAKGWHLRQMLSSEPEKSAAYLEQQLSAGIPLSDALAHHEIPETESSETNGDLTMNGVVNGKTVRFCSKAAAGTEALPLELSACPLVIACVHDLSVALIAHRLSVSAINRRMSGTPGVSPLDVTMGEPLLVAEETKLPPIGAVPAEYSPTNGGLQNGLSHPTINTESPQPSPSHAYRHVTEGRSSRSGSLARDLPHVPPISVALNSPHGSQAGSRPGSPGSSPSIKKRLSVPQSPVPNLWLPSPAVIGEDGEPKRHPFLKNLPKLAMPASPMASPGGSRSGSPTSRERHMWGQKALEFERPYGGRSSRGNSLSNVSASPGRALGLGSPSPSSRDRGVSDGWKRGNKLAFFAKDCTQITDWMYVGGKQIAQDLEMLKATGITHVLNCAGDICDNYFTDDFTYLKLFLLDSPNEDLMCVLYEALDYIDSARKSGGRIFVHCQQGVSRSTVVCIAYLMHLQSKDYNECFEYVRARRGVCRPNVGFMCQLMAWRKRVTGLSHRPACLYRIAPHCTRDRRLVAKWVDRCAARPFRF